MSRGGGTVVTQVSRNLIAAGPKPLRSCHTSIPQICSRPVRSICGGSTMYSFVISLRIPCHSHFWIQKAMSRCGSMLPSEGFLVLIFEHCPLERFLVFFCVFVLFISFSSFWCPSFDPLQKRCTTLVSTAAWLTLCLHSRESSTQHSSLCKRPESQIPRIISKALK